MADVVNKDVPKQEDIPIILAWMMKATFEKQCAVSWCMNKGEFAYNTYEDPQVILPLMRAGISNDTVLQEIIWENTKREQVVEGKYIVHETRYECFECLLRHMKMFLNTEEEFELRSLLDMVRQGKVTLVQHHWLSNPEYGLCAVVPADIGIGITRVRDLVKWMQDTTGYGWKIGEGETGEMR